jgi:hypothetical protein
MTAREVDVQTFCARMNDAYRRSVLEALGNGMGVARFGYMNLTYGKRGAVIEGQYPPAMYGSSEIGDFVAPPPVPASKRSPLLDALGGPPQIRRPHVSPSQTEGPAVEIETRVSNHPRSGGFIDAQRFAVPGREQEQQQPQRELSETEAWFTQHLGRGR